MTSQKGNRVCTNIRETARRGKRRFRALTAQNNADRWRRHIKDHLRLLDLLEAGRNADAAKLMLSHLRRSPLASGG